MLVIELLLVAIAVILWRLLLAVHGLREHPRIDQKGPEYEQPVATESEPLARDDDLQTMSHPFFAAAQIRAAAMAERDAWSAYYHATTGEDHVDIHAIAVMRGAELRQMIETNTAIINGSQSFEEAQVEWDEFQARKQHVVESTRRLLQHGG